MALRTDLRLLFIALSLTTNPTFTRLSLLALCLCSKILPNLNTCLNLWLHLVATKMTLQSHLATVVVRARALQFAPIADHRKPATLVSRPKTAY